MGFNPFKAVTKPFKKILRSPIGKAALGIGAFMYGPKMWGGDMGSAGWGQGWEKFAPWLMGTKGTPGVPDTIGIPAKGNLWQRMGTLGKAATVGVGAAAAGALGDDPLEKSKTVIDDRGHKDYLNAREMYLDEWAKWLMDQDDTLTYEEAMEKVSDPLFEKAQGGLIGLAQGGRIGLAEGRNWMGDYDPGNTTGWKQTGQVESGGGSQGTTTSFTGPKIPDAPGKINRITADELKAMNILEADAKEEKVEKLRNKNIGDGWWKGPFNKQMSVNQNFFLDKVLPAQKGMFKGKDIYGMSDEDQETLYQNWMDQRQSGVIDAYGNLKSGYSKEQIPHTDRFGNVTYKEVIMGEGGGGGPGLNFNASVGTGGGGGVGTGETTGDYYGFKEWEDWAGAPTTPLFGDTTKYKALLNRGGRIGLYAGGMGAMNSPMNPMMNQGLGAMGSQGMNPFNQ